MNEANVTINGMQLSESGAMVIRVALNNFLLDLMDEKNQNDDAWERMRVSYKESAHMLLSMMTKG